MNPKFVGSPQAASVELAHTIVTRPPQAVTLTQMESDIINFLDTIPSEPSKERFTVTGD